MGGFKSPPLPDINDDFLESSAWLTDMVSADEILQPRMHECPQCYNDIFTGQRICLSCGYRVKYASVEMEVDEDEDPVGEQGYEEVIRSISPDAIVSRDKKVLEAMGQGSGECLASLAP